MGRGLIRAGKLADLVLFDPATVQDLATYDDPKPSPPAWPWWWSTAKSRSRPGATPGVAAGRMLRYRQDD